MRGNMASVKISVKASDLKEGKPVGAEINGKKVMLVRVQGKIYAIDSVCSHRGGPLEKGLMDGYNVKCPWHGSIYDVRTGKVSPDTPWGKGQASYPVSDDPDTGEITLEI